MRRCIKDDEVYDILKACHAKPCGEHFATKRVVLKILNTVYYWPTLHKDIVKYTRIYDRCQRMGRPTKIDKIPLQPQLVLAPFDKWGLDFIGPISPTSNNKEYILVCIDYLTKWMEVKFLQYERDGNVAKLLYEDICKRHGVSREIVIDQGP